MMLLRPTVSPSSRGSCSPCEPPGVGGQNSGVGHCYETQSVGVGPRPWCVKNFTERKRKRTVKEFHRDYWACYSMSLISCSGCGGKHERQGGSFCKYLKPSRLEMASGGGRGTNPTFGVRPGCQIGWSKIVSPEELSSIPGRGEDGYLGFRAPH